jgi:hypothetical protein
MKCRVWGWSFPNYVLCTFTSIPNGQSASSIYCLRFRAKMPCHFLDCVVLCQSRCCARSYSRNAKASESQSMGDLMWIFSLITYTSDCYLSNQKLLLSASFAEAPICSCLHLSQNSQASRSQSQEMLYYGGALKLLSNGVFHCYF